MAEVAGAVAAPLVGGGLSQIIGNALGNGGQQSYMESPTIDPEVIKRQRAQADQINAMLNNQANPFGQQNTNLLALMQQQALGQGPSAAQQMFQNAQGQNAQNALAMAASQRGVNPVLAQRQAMMQNNMMNQQSAGQMAALRAQEQQGALGQLGGYENQLRGLQQGYEGLGANAANANLQAQMGTNQMNTGIGARNLAGQQQFQAGIANGLGGAMGMMGNSFGNFFGNTPSPDHLVGNEAWNKNLKSGELRSF